MSAVQLVVIVFAVAMGFATYRTYRRRDLQLAEAIVWAAVWAALIVVTAFPDALRGVIGPLKFARLLDLVVIAGILLLTVLVFLLNARVRRTERRTVELVQRLALSADQASRQGQQPEREVQEHAGKPREPARPDNLV